MMTKKCSHHKNKNALSFCYSCSLYFCSECLSRGVDHYYCKSEHCQEALHQELYSHTQSNSAPLALNKEQVPRLVRPQQVVSDTENELIDLTGSKWVCIRSRNEHNEPVVFCKTLTRKDMDEIRDNPGLLDSPGKLYEMLTDDLNLFLNRGKSD